MGIVFNNPSKEHHVFIKKMIGYYRLIAILLSIFSAFALADNSCTTYEDCSKEGKMCFQLADAGCICKNGQCKISSGCGTQGAFFRTACSTCSQEDCEDEGACKWVNNQCTPGSPTPTASVSGCTTIAGDSCRFPFTFKGVKYDACTTDHSENGAPWCAVQVNNRGRVVRGRWGDCAGNCPGSAADESCRTFEDCRRPGKKCHQLADASCICKNGQCKISSGCGTHGAFFRTACNTCNQDDCEDEGACKWVNRRCNEN